jgi:hypothetical protein
MIILDTNVVSEAMKPEPNPSVQAWLNNQAAETLYLSSARWPSCYLVFRRCQRVSAKPFWRKRLMD